MLMQNFGGQIRHIMGDVQVAHDIFLGLTNIKLSSKFFHNSRLINLFVDFFLQNVKSSCYV